MPTRKDLHDSWRAQFILGMSDEQYYCQDHNPQYVPPKDNPVQLNGEQIGTIEYDPLTERILFKPLVEKD